MMLFSGPIKHNPTGSGSGQPFWWVECRRCAGASLASLAQLRGEEAHTCPDCGRIVTRRLLREVQIDAALDRARV